MAPTTRTAARNGSTATTRSSSATPSRGGPLRRPGRHNSGRIAAGLALIALSCLGAATLYSSAADRVEVIGIARDIPPGATVTEADLRKISISTGSGLQTLPVERASEVVGRTAGTGLTAGSLLNPDQLADGPALPAGTVLVGAVLKAGQYPVGLRIGDTVEIVETPAPDSTGSRDPESQGVGTVTDQSDLADGQSSRTVSIAVPPDDSARISAAGAAGRLSLVVTSP